MVSKSSIWAHIQSFLGPPIPLKRKIRDTVIEAKTKYVGRKIRE